jgi:hypothetical protein
LDPPIADDILLIVDSEKPEMKIARIEDGSSDDAQQDNAAI